MLSALAAALILSAAGPARVVYVNGAFERVNLSIDIGLRHVVQIDQGQAPHPAARQGFHRPRAHATDPHHGNVRLANGLGARHAVQARQTSKTSVLIWRDHHPSSRSKRAT